MLAGASADDIIPREAGGNSYACFYRELDECIGREVISERLFEELWVVLQKNSEKKGNPCFEMAAEDEIIRKNAFTNFP